MSDSKLHKKLNEGVIYTTRLGANATTESLSKRHFNLDIVSLCHLHFSIFASSFICKKYFS